MTNTDKKQPITVDEIIEEFKPRTAEEYFNRLIGFEEGIMKNYEKYHSKDNKGANPS